MKTAHTFFLILVLALLAAFLPPRHTRSRANAAALFATITVNDTGNAAVGGDAKCTLREAITNANNNSQLAGSVAGDCAAGSGTDTIAFNIPGAGPHTISPTSALPAITGPVIIDGTTQPGASCTTVGGLKIELNGAGAGAVSGLQITAGNSTVRGLVINRFAQSGVLLITNGSNTVSCNYLGTDMAGAQDLGNTQNGVSVDNAPNNLIGGTDVAARNLISGNDFSGVRLQNGATGNRVEGNLIGTNASGLAAIANSFGGVFVGNAPNNVIGGTAAGARNLISGNNFSGIFIAGPTATNNRVEGNYIGTDATGNAALGNSGSAGVYLQASNNVVGGTTAAARNVISGNQTSGVITFRNVTLIPTGNRIQGNYIGVNAAGTTSLGNRGNGVNLSDAVNTLVGGTSAAARNVISGNTSNGVSINNPASTGNVIQGNYIGTDVSGAANLGNGLTGVFINANNNLLGGAAAEANVIAFNRSAGVAVLSGSGQANRILSNAIFANGSLGIDLTVSLVTVGDGVTPNDAADADTGANNKQNFPVFTSAVSSGGATTIQGTLNSTPGRTFRIQFFANPQCDPTGFGEGQTFLGEVNVTTDGAGNAAINAPFPLNLSGQFITSTATDLTTNDTSEFSQCVLGIAPPQNALARLTPDDPLLCAGARLNGAFGQTNTTPVPVSGRVFVTLQNLTATPSSVVCTLTPATGGATTFCDIENNQPTWRGTLAAGQRLDVSYQTQIPESVTTQVCSTASAQFPDVVGPVASIAPFCLNVNCPGTAGPGQTPDVRSIFNDGKPGSVLIFNAYTSSATSAGFAPTNSETGGADNLAAAQTTTIANTRINLTNTSTTSPVFVHLFFVDGSTCAVADNYLCLTPNQTASFLASDLDPGTAGYLVAVAVDRLGCPVVFNHLIGDEYVRFASGHAANLAAEAVAAVPGALPFCDASSDTALLRFDGISYNALPHVLAVDNVPSRLDGNDTLLILNRLGGSLVSGAATLGTVVGLFYDDAENALSFSFTAGTCQTRASLSNSFPRIAPRFETFVPAGRSGWLKLYAPPLIGLSGAVINLGTNAQGFNQGHNLHKLTLTPNMLYTIPVFPPAC